MSGLSQFTELARNDCVVIGVVISMGVRAENLAFVREIKLSRGCEQCGYGLNGSPEMSVALDFDHIDPKTKGKYRISDLCAWAPSEQTRQRLLDEIAKCRVLCANCHRIHTARQIADGTVLVGWKARKSDMG